MLKKIFKKIIMPLFNFLFLPILAFNYFAWLFFFDWDNKINIGTLFLFFNIILGLVKVFFSNDSKKLKHLIKKTIFIIYFFTSIELFSYFTITFLMLNDGPISDGIKYALNTLTYQSKHISWMTPDLRSDYKPNIFNPKVNQYGYRIGGKNNTENIFKIMCIGGSTTWGSTVHDSLESYPAQLKKYLTDKGYNIDIVNAGVPYHTSLDALMRFITKGIYYKPDMVLIHTGGNDVGPLNSPYDYKPDYSHWRDSGTSDENKLFKKYWTNIPISSFRLILIYYFKPGNGDKTSFQTSFTKEELLAKTPVNKTRTIGLENYFSTIIAILKHNKIIPVTILFNSKQSRKTSQANEFFEKHEIKYAKERRDKSIELHNSIMDSISFLNSVKVIEFNKFEPSLESCWVDCNHLDSIGIKEKAEYIGQFLVNNYPLLK
jgi:hypothetical protein|tara:strand:+ start:198 stop:1490 length:1293 start_codon:yes stop_codon:yes gene_type:complete